MIRLTLRQLRIEAVIAVALLAVLAVLLGINGVHPVPPLPGPKLNGLGGAAGCKLGAAACLVISAADRLHQSVVVMVAIFAPALVGMFIGAPLIARELETGTFRMVWTQGVTRRRWLAVKLGVVGLTVVGIAGPLAWMVDRWLGPIDAVNRDIFDPGIFDYHGVVLIGYAAFAFALGAAAGVLLRHTVAAMGVTLVGFVAARLAVYYWVRPNLVPPVRESIPLSIASIAPGTRPNTFSIVPRVQIPNAWVYSSAVVDHAGHAPTSQYLLHACPGLGELVGQRGLSNAPQSAVQACIHQLSATLHTVVVLQPASRFWPFQLAELGIFLAAAFALGGLTYWWLRRQ